MADRKIIRDRNAERKSCRRCWALVAFIPLVIVLASCAGQPVQMGSLAKTVPVEQAMVMPPPSGPGIVSVVERRYDNAVEQEIHLSTSAMTPGQNMLTAQLFGTTSPFRMSSNNLTSTPVSEVGIASEMRHALPGVRMARSQFYVQNSYGPFGYAFGRGPGSDLCIYGWQQIRSPTGTISPLANFGSIQVRLRICEAGATEQKLLAVMYNFTVVGSVDAPGWNPYGEPGSVSPALGGIGAPTYPKPASTEPMVPMLPPRQSVVVRRAPVMTSSVSPERPGTNAPATAEPIAAAAAPGGPPAPQIPSPAALSVPATQETNGSALVPSPPLSAAAQRVTVPSPSCVTQKEGSDIACR